MKRRLRWEIQLRKNQGVGVPNGVTVSRVNVTKTKTSIPPPEGEWSEKGDPKPIYSYLRLACMKSGMGPTAKSTEIMEPPIPADLR